MTTKALIPLEGVLKRVPSSGIEKNPGLFSRLPGLVTLFGVLPLSLEALEAFDPSIQVGKGFCIYH